jgi:serine/threonine-protein kinase RsbW
MPSDAHPHDRPAPEEYATRLMVAPHPERKRETLDRLVSEVEAAGYPTAAVFAVRLAVEEALTNAMSHGHAELPEQPVSVSWRVDPERVDVEIVDQGPGFDPSDTPDPTLEENLDKPAGRGLMLMRAYMAHVSFNERGNRVTMTYLRAGDEGGS